MIELIIPTIVTAIAVLTAFIAIPYFLPRRWRHEERLKQTARDIPHVDSKWCRCYWCTIDRIQNDEL